MASAASIRRTAATHVFVDAATLDADGPVDLDRETEHHLTRVLRLRAGEQVTLSDGVGRWRGSTLTDSGLITSSGVEFEERTHPALTISTAIPKGDRVEWLVQKAVEIGVDTVQFLHAERSAVRWKPDRAAKQLERLRRIALEAARQSRRVWLPDVRAPVDAHEVLTHSVIAEPGGRAVGAGDTSLTIGPEGGWTTEEVDMASDQVKLGPNILRTETAALVAATLYVAANH